MMMDDDDDEQQQQQQQWQQQQQQVNGFLPAASSTTLFLCWKNCTSGKSDDVDDWGLYWSVRAPRGVYEKPFSIVCAHNLFIRILGAAETIQYNTVQQV